MKSCRASIFISKADPEPLELQMVDLGFSNDLGMLRHFSQSETLCYTMVETTIKKRETVE